MSDRWKVWGVLGFLGLLGVIGVIALVAIATILLFPTRPSSGPQSLSGPVGIAAMAAESHGYLGVELESPVEGEVRILQVFPGGAAARGGLAEGDVVLAVDGRTVRTVADVQEVVRARKVGETVTLSLRRGDEELRLDIPLMAP